MKDKKQLHIFVDEKIPTGTVTNIKVMANIEYRDNVLKKALIFIFRYPLINAYGLKLNGIMKYLQRKDPKVYYDSGIISRILDELIADGKLTVVDEDNERVFFSKTQNKLSERLAVL